MARATRLALAILTTLGVLAGLSATRSATPAGAQNRLVQWAYVVAEDSDSLRSFQTNASSLDFVSPKSYSVDAQGALRGSVSATLTTSARRSGVRILPLIQNDPRYGEFSPVLRKADFRARALNEIVGAVDREGWDGVNLDFEALEPADREVLTGFASELATRLHSRGKLFTIAVPARMPSAETRWNAPYDYGALAGSSDYVVIMAYAFHGPSSSPGSIAPLTAVEDASRYAISLIPRDKLLLGIGLWGYDWRIGASGAAPRKYAETKALGTKYAGEFGYSQTDQSAWLKYRDSGGQRIIWFEDRQAVAAKTGVASRNGLAGVAYWRLGQEDPGMWDAVPPRSPAGSTGDPDYAIAGGWFYSQTGGGGGKGYGVVDGGTDAAGNPIRFWSEFKRLGGITTLGYPISRRYVGPGGFTYQGFQRGVLQWRPEVGAAYLANTFDQLTAAGLDDDLAGIGIPRSIRDDGSGGDWAAARRIRLDWLTNDPIRQHFRRSPNPTLIRVWNDDTAIQLYGLPTSRPEQSGPFIVQRFQRVALQLWIEDVAGMPARGSVVGILGGDLLKQRGLIPADAAQPETP